MITSIYATNTFDFDKVGGTERLQRLGFDWDVWTNWTVADLSMDDVHAIVREFGDVVVTFFEEPVGHEGIRVSIEIQA